MRTTCSALAFVVALVALSPPTTLALTTAACRTDGRPVMGTILEVRLCDEAGSDPFENAFETASQLDALFTTWADDSAVLRLNRAQGRAIPEVPEPLRLVLKEAIELSRTTGGAFDVTVGPLIDVWRAAGRSGVLPSAALLAESNERVGSDRIEIRPDHSVRLPSGGSIDLGGLGKGFALDRITAQFRAAGVTSGLLDFGQSSLVAIGAPPDARAWDLLVRRPDGPVIGIVSLRDSAASTSTTFGRSTEIAGRRYSHVIDPRTGRPVATDRLAFVTAPDASLAEALSTALVVWGVDGLPIIERLAGVEALVVEGTRAPTRTSGFDRATKFRPAPEYDTRPPPGLRDVVGPGRRTTHP